MGQIGLRVLQRRYNKYMKTEDITGQKFGYLTVLEYAGSGEKHRQAMWKCKCDCGTEIVVIGAHLKSGHTKSCRCHGNPQKEVQCKICSNLFKEKISRIKGGRGKYCSRECYAEMLRQRPMEEHGNWRGGLSFEPYPTKWTEDLKESIRKRDGYSCCECGEEQNGKKLSVHHIDYDKENLDPKNLISLCRSCHTKTNYDRDYWENYLITKLLRTDWLTSTVEEV